MQQLHHTSDADSHSSSCLQPQHHLCSKSGHANWQKNITSSIGDFSLNQGWKTAGSSDPQLEIFFLSQGWKTVGSSDPQIPLSKKLLTLSKKLEEHKPCAFTFFGVLREKSECTRFVFSEHTVEKNFHTVEKNLHSAEKFAHCAKKFAH